jgi:hypothetical protein
MTLADNQQQRLLERLRQAGEQPVDFAELHAGGIDFPAAVVCELELNGYTTERVYDNGRLVGVRLVGPEPPRSARRTPPPPVDAPVASRCTPRFPADHQAVSPCVQSRELARSRYGPAR